MKDTSFEEAINKQAKSTQAVFDTHVPYFDKIQEGKTKEEFKKIQQRWYDYLNKKQWVNADVVLAEFDKWLQQHIKEDEQWFIETVKKVRDKTLKEQKQKLQADLQPLIDILALPNMGDEGRKMKLIEIKEWQILFLKKFEQELQK